MKNIIKIAAMFGVFIFLLCANINVTNDKMSNSNLYKLSLKSITQTATASSQPSCVEALFYPSGYTQSEDVYGCWDMGELCGLWRQCLPIGGQFCQETVCTNP